MNVADVIEESLGAAIDSDLIVNVRKLKVSDLQELLEAYELFAGSFQATVPAGELWPQSIGLLQPYWQRTQEGSEAALRRAMSILLYSHGLFVKDALGYLLVESLNPKSVGGKTPRWVFRKDAPAKFSNYLEKLAFLRPLIDARLLTILPHTTRVADGVDEDYIFLEDDLGYHDAGALAVEYVHGQEGLERYRTFISQLSKEWTPVPKELIAGTDMWKGAFGSVERRLAALDSGSPGHLYLESAEQVAAFEWLLDRSHELNQSSRDSRRLATIESMTAPRIDGLAPHDLVALHESSEFGDYRLALKRGLERVELFQVAPGSDTFEALKEELRGAQRAATRTTVQNSYLQEKKRIGRDLIIGAAIGGGLSPLTGLEPAALAYGGVVGRSALSLVWSWLKKSKSADEEDGLARCFAAFLDSASGE